MGGLGWGRLYFGGFVVVVVVVLNYRFVVGGFLLGFVAGGDRG